MKRIFDILVSIIGLLFLSPVFLVIALLIWMEDQGPVFYRQERVGKNGRIFMLIKFRSMKQTGTGTKGRFDPGDKSRITGVGRVLRRRKLDELPQLFNVFVGDMSLVGPRPEIEKWVAVYPERWEKVLSIRPGITDNASILYREEESLLASSENPVLLYRRDVLPKKLRHYEEYVSNHSLLGDIGIILRTIFH